MQTVHQRLDDAERAVKAAFAGPDSLLVLDDVEAADVSDDRFVLSAAFRARDLPIDDPLEELAAVFEAEAKRLRSRK